MKAFLLCSLLVAAAHAEEFKVPPLTTPVVDAAHILSESTRVRLNETLSALNTATPMQFAILTVPTLSGIPVEQAALKVAETWKLGRKDTDQGLLLLIALKEHKIRFEVGQGLEGDLPDVFVFRLITQQMSPLFKQGQVDEAITTAVYQVIKQAHPEFPVGDHLEGYRPHRTYRQHNGLHFLGLPFDLWIILIVVVMSLLISLFRRGGGSGFYGGGWGGGGTFGSGGSSGWGGGGFSGGGGGFSGGGASGDW